MDAVKRRVSFADLQRMPDDGNRYELYDGELRVVPTPILRHQIVARRLVLAFAALADECGGEVLFAPLDVVFTEYNVVEPDVMYFGPESAKHLQPHDWVRVAPDIAIEILSPSTARVDRGRKRDLLARFRVPEYWIVDPDARRIEVYSPANDAYGPPQILDSGLLTSITFPHIAVAIEPLFDGLG